MKFIVELKKAAHDKLEEELNELMSDCEKYPDIAEFVEILWEGGEVGHHLSTLIWKITNVGNIEPEKPLAFLELNSFIGNYFLDDAYFTVFKDRKTGEWTASSEKEMSRKRILSKDPQVLIIAARENARFCAESEKALEEWCNTGVFAKVKMKKTVAVEKQLEKGAVVWKKKNQTW